MVKKGGARGCGLGAAGRHRACAAQRGRFHPARKATTARQAPYLVGSHLLAQPMAGRAAFAGPIRRLDSKVLPALDTAKAQA